MKRHEDPWGKDWPLRLDGLIEAHVKGYAQMTTHLDTAKDHFKLVEEIIALRQRAEKAEALLCEIDTALVSRNIGIATDAEGLAASVQTILHWLDMAGFTALINPEENPLGAANEVLRQRAEDAELVAWGLVRGVEKRGLARIRFERYVGTGFGEQRSPAYVLYQYCPSGALLSSGILPTGVDGIPVLNDSARAILKAAKEGEK